MLPAGCEARCPGCAHRALSAAASAAQKERWLRERLAPWQDAFSPLRAIAERQRWAYRDKIRLATAWTNTGWRFGLTVREELIPIPRCPVHSQRARDVVQLLMRELPPGPLFPLAFYAQSGAQATLVLKTNRLPNLSWLDDEFRQALARTGLEGLWLHLHPCAGRRLFSKNGWHLLWGQPRSRDQQGLVYGPEAFQQLIPTLYEYALDQTEVFFAPAMGDSVIDLYSGAGASLVRWLGKGARTVGVELGGEAIECARQNAPGALLLRGACAARIPQLDAWLAEATAGRRLLYANPPRTGLEPKVLAWINERCRPERMAYLSCSAGTLRRDLDALCASGYRVERITPYDFFPQTYHVETLVLLKR